MINKVDQNNPRFRVRGEEGSEQNKLRGQLYDEAFRRTDMNTMVKEAKMIAGTI